MLFQRNVYSIAVDLFFLELDMKSNRKYHYECKEYPMYTFVSSGYQQFKVTVTRGLDAMLMIDLLVGEILTLIPIISKTGREEKYFMCKIMTIDQSENGRRCYITMD